MFMTSMNSGRSIIIINHKRKKKKFRIITSHNSRQLKKADVLTYIILIGINI